MVKDKGISIMNDVNDPLRAERYPFSKFTMNLKLLLKYSLHERLSYFSLVHYTSRIGAGHVSMRRIDVAMEQRSATVVRQNRVLAFLAGCLHVASNPQAIC